MFHYFDFSDVYEGSASFEKIKQQYEKNSFSTRRLCKVNLPTKLPCYLSFHSLSLAFRTQHIGNSEYLSSLVLTYFLIIANHFVSFVFSTTIQLRKVSTHLSSLNIIVFYLYKWTTIIPLMALWNVRQIYKFFNKLL